MKNLVQPKQIDSCGDCENTQGTGCERNLFNLGMIVQAMLDKAQSSLGLLWAGSW